MYNKIENYLRIKGKLLQEILGEINGSNLPINYIPVNYTLYSGSTLISNLQGIDQRFSQTISSSVDLNYSYHEVKDINSTTTPFYVNANTLNFYASSSSDYRVSWFYTWNSNASSSIQIQLDNTQEIFLQERRSLTKDQYNESGIYLTSLTSGSHNIKLNIKSNEPGKEISIYLSRLEVFKV